jgi:hypothetical protein
VRAIAFRPTVTIIALGGRYDADVLGRVDDIIGYAFFGWWALFNTFCGAFSWCEIADDPKPISEVVADASAARRKKNKRTASILLSV